MERKGEGESEAEETTGLKVVAEGEERREGEREGEWAGDLEME